MPVNVRQNRATRMSPLRRSGDIPVAEIDHHPVRAIPHAVRVRLDRCGSTRRKFITDFARFILPRAGPISNRQRVFRSSAILGAT